MIRAIAASSQTRRTSGRVDHRLIEGMTSPAVDACSGESAERPAAG
jgi:hypothetical protein